MRFALFAISMKDFKCFYGTHEYEFPQDAGLYYLTGRNDFNSRLGANGVGKSSIIDGINWCFYGKTSRGLRASDVVSWNKKSCEVSVTCLIGEDEVEITRSQNPNKISINGNPVSQDEVTKLLRLNQDAFNASVIIPQFGESFFDLSPSRKLEIFAQVMNLDYWLDKSKQADKEASILANYIAIGGQSIAKVLGKLDNLRSSVKDYKAKVAEYVNETEAEVTAIEKDIEKEKEKGDVARAGLKKLAKKADGKDDDLNEVRLALTEAAVDFEKIEKKFLDLLADHKSSKRREHELRDAYSDTTKLRGTTCTACKQSIDGKHIAKQQKLIAKEISKYEDISSDLNKGIEKLEGKRAALRKDVVELNSIKIRLERETTQISNDATNFKRDIKQSLGAIESLNDSIKRLRDKENPFEAMLERARKQRKQYKNDLSALQEQTAKHQKKHAAYSYWIGGFKRVRLFVIEEALNSLEVEVNNLLISLGLVGWKITFDVERETKSGGVSKGFTVFITSPKHDKPVRFESWSGGETQRLRLAGDLGLANLIMEQAGFVNSIELIDEPSTHMSQQGIEDLLETLDQRAHDTGKQIWIADHHSVEFSGFEGTLSVIMDNKGKSHLEYAG